MTASAPTLTLHPSGIIPPMVTPLAPDREPDLGSTDSLTDFLLDNGASGVLVLGSCGENGALSRTQRLAVAARVVGHVGDRGHVMVGLPALGLGDAVADAREYAAMGADSLLVPPPFVFAHSPAELRGYFRSVAAAGNGVPIFAYNVPGRTGVVLDVDLVRALAEEGVLTGVKDSSGDLEAQRLLAEATADIADFVRLSGTELCIDGVLLGGFHGAIPGLANPFVELHVELARRAAAGDWTGAAEMQSRICALFGLYQHAAGEGSFSSVVVAVLKEALVQRGVIAGATTAAPFHPAGDALREHVARYVARAGELVQLGDAAVSR